eukprot:Em0007g1490a
MALRGLGVRYCEVLKHQQEPRNRQFIAGFLRSIGMSNSRMDDKGQLSLSFSKSNGQPGDPLVLTFICHGSDSIDAVTFIGLIGKNEDNLKKLLEWNFVPMHHGGGQFALEPRSDRLVMVGSWDTTKVSVEEFSKRLEEFINSAERGQALFA